MSHPMGPRSPSKPVRSLPYSQARTPSPLRRQPEIHSRSKSYATGPDLGIIARGERHSVEPETRYSHPVLSEEEAASSYQPQYIKPLSINKTIEDQRPGHKQVESNSLEAESVPSQDPVPAILAASPEPALFSPRKGHPARTSSLQPEPKKVKRRPKLLTDVSDEDFLRKNHLRGASLGHIPATPETAHCRKAFELERLSEDEESSPTSTRSFGQRPDRSAYRSAPDLSPIATHTRSKSQKHKRSPKLDRSVIYQQAISNPVRSGSRIYDESPKLERSAKLQASASTPTKSISKAHRSSSKHGRRSKVQGSCPNPTKSGIRRQATSSLDLVVPEPEPLYVEKSNPGQSTDIVLQANVQAFDEGVNVDQTLCLVPQAVISKHQHLELQKSASNQSTGTIIRTVLEHIDEESKNWQTPSPQLDAANNPRPNTLYIPDLFATQHGVPPNLSKQGIVAKKGVLKRKPVSSPQKVTFALASSPISSISTPSKRVLSNTATVQDPPSSPLTHSGSLVLGTRSATPTAVKTTAASTAAAATTFYPAVAPGELRLSPAPASSLATTQTKGAAKFANRYITALQITASASEEVRAASKLKRHQSLAKIRRLTPSPITAHHPNQHIRPRTTTPNRFYSSDSNGEANDSLSTWIDDLCNARTPISPATISQAAVMENPRSKSRSGRAVPAQTRNFTTTTDADDEKDNNIYDDTDLLSNPEGGGGGGDGDDGGEQDGFSSGKKSKVTASEELTVMIDDMLSDMQGKFHAVTSEIMAKMDDMGRRIDNMEASLVRDGNAVGGEEQNGSDDGEKR